MYSLHTISSGGFMFSLFLFLVFLLQKQKQYLYDLSQLKDHYEDRCSCAKRLRELHKTQKESERETERDSNVVSRVANKVPWFVQYTYNEMWRRKQHRQRGYNGEKRENYKAQTIHDHRSEFPVTCYIACFVLFLKLCASGKIFEASQSVQCCSISPTHLIGYPAQLLQYQRQFVFRRGAQTGVGNGFVHASITHGGNGSNGTHRTNATIIALPVGRAQ